MQKINQDTSDENSMYGSCTTKIEEWIHSRQCFMTGEYCSKLTNIQRERKNLHKKDCINAFVIMNFSNMSDVMYKWRLKSFIQSLTKFLYIDDKKEKLRCCPSAKAEAMVGWNNVNEINVIRADSDPDSNFVICNSVCQQMQIADLIIVDVSIENTNVFYEFGMAVALGKMILPICYSESFYAMEFPDIEDIKQKKKELEHHIGCYPWRKRLFEYYGIRYRSAKPRNGGNGASEIANTEYTDFDTATKEKNGFEDVKYDRFPYHEKIRGHEHKIGREIYEKLSEAYNNAGYDNNTLVVYTMDGFLNEVQAGQCIVNFYYNITKPMKEEQCFRGERVGILVQANTIPEDVKDAKSKKELLYSVGEIIHIGMNQATYVAAGEKIKTEDFLQVPGELTEYKKKNDSGFEEFVPQESDWEKDVRRFIKEHIRNKGMLIYPNDPVYVNRVKNELQKEILENCDYGGLKYSFNLYRVMLRNLRYTNEIVVDISHNCLQSLFWLGAAHGADIYAITVRHEETNKEREIMTGSPEKKERSIFDVAGLWTAILRSHDTEGFYQQLALAQFGIEQRSKLMLKNVKDYEQRMLEIFHEYGGNSSEEGIKELMEDKRREEAGALESYYRKCFWNPMLQYNRLRIYLHQVDDTDSKDGEPRLHTVKWDVDAISALSRYLSKRKVIGEYLFKPLRKGEFDKAAEDTNFICIGNAAEPLENKSECSGENTCQTVSLADYIKSMIGSAESKYGTNYNVIHKHWQNETETKKNCDVFACDKEKILLYKGFAPIGDCSKGIFTQQPQSICDTCIDRVAVRGEDSEAAVMKVYHSIDETKRTECRIRESKTRNHIQLAQLILWRDTSLISSDRSNFRVALIGCSGPATYGLSTIFIDDDQKEELFGVCENSEGRFLLSRLQENIRKKLMDVFLVRLQDKLNKIDTGFGDNGEMCVGSQKECYFKRVKHVAAAYLSTVLYRYFLPFLSKDDEQRICNGMKTYVSAMMAANISPFALNYVSSGYEFASGDFVKEAAKSVTDSLEIVLKSFKGVEAFYQVEVRVEGLNDCGKQDENRSNKEKQRRDTRKVVGIKELVELNNFYFNCLFKFED